MAHVLQLLSSKKRKQAEAASMMMSSTESKDVDVEEVKNRKDSAVIFIDDDSSPPILSGQVLEEKETEKRKSKEIPTVKVTTTVTNASSLPASASRVPAPLTFQKRVKTDAPLKFSKEVTNESRSRSASVQSVSDDVVVLDDESAEDDFGARHTEHASEEASIPLKTPTTDAKAPPSKQSKKKFATTSVSQVSQSAKKTGLLDGYFSKPSAIRSEFVVSLTEAETVKEDIAVTSNVMEEAAVHSEVNPTDSAAPVSELLAQAHLSETQGPDLLEEHAQPGKKTVEVTAKKATSANATKKRDTVSASSKKAIKDEDMPRLKTAIRAAVSKTKEILLKEIRELVPDASKDVISAKLADVAIKMTDGGSLKVWRLREEVPEQELAAFEALEVDKKLKASAKKSPVAPVQQAEAVVASQETGASESTPLAVSSQEEEVQVMESECAVSTDREAPLNIDVQMTSQEKITPVVVPLLIMQPPKPKDVDAAVVILLEQSKKLNGDLSAFFTDVFTNCEGAWTREVLQGLASKVPLEAFENKEPCEEIIKLISAVVSDSRKVEKTELVQLIAERLESAQSSASSMPSRPTNATVETWLDLVAKRVEYFDGHWGFEMEKNNDKHGKSRRMGLRAGFALHKAIVKFEKDATSGKVASDKLAVQVKEMQEKLAKAQREWFNRDEKKLSVAASVVVSAVGSSTATATSMTTTTTKAGSKTKVVASGAVASTPLPPSKPVNNILSFLAKRPVTTATAPATTIIPTMPTLVPTSTASTSSLNESPLPASSAISSSQATTTSTDVPSSPQKPVALLARFNDESAKKDGNIVIEITESDDSSCQLVEAPAVPISSPINPKSKKRQIVLFIDTRLRMKAYSRAKGDEHDYFSKRAEVNGRRPFAKSRLLDYEIDSDDEDGESLSGASQGEEEEEDAGLDYKDGWLERDEVLTAPFSSFAENDQQLAKQMVPCIVGVCYSLDPVKLKMCAVPQLSIRNQAFEQQMDDEAQHLSKFLVTVRKRTLEEATAAIVKTATNAEVTPATASEVGRNDTYVPAATREPKPKKQKLVKSDAAITGETGADKVSKPKRLVQDGPQLRMFVELIEGSASPKGTLVDEVFEKMKVQFSETFPSKTCIQAKLSEIAENINKRWSVKEEILQSVGIEPTPLEVNLSLFDKMAVLNGLKNQGIDAPSEEQIRQADLEFFKKKLAASAALAKQKKKKSAVPSTKQQVNISNSAAAAANVSTVSTSVVVVEASPIVVDDVKEVADEVGEIVNNGV